MTQDAPPPTAYELMVAIRRLNMESDRFIERFAVLHGLHRTDLNALVVILDAANAGRHPTPGELGAALNLSPPATSALVNRLEQAGHVERRRSTTDRRKIEIAVNEPAVRLAGRFFAPLGRHLTAAIDEFTPDEREIIARFLTRAITATTTAVQETTT
ncbi:MarR family winged helix-turn-helix transcriptional regulator [Nonomuraea muscovyensis]|uniref:DNA-binding MarR family transcriptional regulator n=1 Tax=Nonomuraea muscovyensis TaxID=1124761 RepID=A0A7X0C1U2_9ACTN|nr:MarR family transcriptional regulator [Nonomuraea muscovyensis]MBB6346807.1 DNA-binding MarR family transcriptional regulator [Nonomuraea muscovyensis]